MKVLFSVMLVLLGMGCSDEKGFVSENTPQSVSAYTNEDTKVSEPVMIGAFLVCETAKTLKCRLDTEDQTNLAMRALCYKLFGR